MSYVTARIARPRTAVLVRLLVLLALLAAGLVFAPPLPAQQPERYVLGGDHVKLYNLAGEIRVVPGTGSDVEIELRRGGRDAGRLEVEVGPYEGADALRVLYPDGRIVYPELGRGRNVNIGMTGIGTTWGHRVIGRKRFEIRSGGSGTEAWADAVVRVPAGKRVEIHLAAGGMTAEDVVGDVVLDSHAASAHARRIRGSLSIDTGSGEARAEDIEGDVAIDTGSGDATLMRVRGRRVNVDTGSGSVRGGGIAADYLQIDTGSGSIHVGVDARGIEIDTGSGSVRLALEGDVDDLEIDTGSGSVTLVVPESLGAELVVDTGSGGIRVEAPHYVVERERRFLRGEIGDGRGQIRIDTGSGRVEVVSG